MNVTRILQDFFVRNKPIFVMGLFTAGLFTTISVLAQHQTREHPTLVEIQPNEMISKHTPITGATDAAITLVEFSEFECPACASYHTIVKTLIEKYPEQIRLVFRHYPLTRHQNAQLAARAAQAAHKQGKFWDYSERLFDNTQDLSQEKLVAYAREVSLDIEQFTKDRGSAEIAAEINEDLGFGTKMGVNNVPTFFVNDKLVETNLEKTIREEFERLEMNLPAEKTEEPVEKHEEITSDNDILKITYGKYGFNPKNTSAVPEQLVRFVNTYEQDIQLAQKQQYSTELGLPVTVKPNETFELRLPSLPAGNKKLLWTYYEVTSGNSGTLNIQQP